jgi:hypothetical protein
MISEELNKKKKKKKAAAAAAPLCLPQTQNGLHLD